MQFIQARNYTKGRIKPIRLVVIHDMEAPEKPDTAENIASWFAGPTAPQASAHVCIDNDSIVGCVHDEDTAWAAPNANSDGLHIEHAGYANQSFNDWLDPFGKAMIEISAKHAAAWCKKYGIPPRHLSISEIRNGAKGFAGHVDITNALNGGSGHTDPGPNFPWDYYLSRVIFYLSPAGVASGGEEMIILLRDPKNGAIYKTDGFQAVHLDGTEYNEIWRKADVKLIDGVSEAIIRKYLVK